MLAVIEWADGSKGSVEKNPCVIGRSGDVRVSNDWVSGKHAELRLKGDGFRLVDLGSTNGTTVGGQKAVAMVEVPVRWGEEVQFGEERGIKFRLLKPEPEVSQEPDTEQVARPPKLRAVEAEEEWSFGTVAEASEAAPRARRGRRPGLTLSERDLDVLEWIAEHRWSTREILVEALYSEPNPEKMRPGKKPSGKYGRGRVAQLERAGFIHPSFIKIGSTVPLLLTPRGYDVLHGQGRVEWAHPFPDIDASRFSHEILVQKLRLALEKFGAEQWLSERRLAQINRKDGLPYVPDARFHAPGGKFALEVERTLKAKKRLHEFLKVRAKSNQSTKMLYVLPERLLKPFGKAIGDSFARFEPGLYVLSAEDFQSGQQKLLVQCLNSDWRTMSLSDLLAGKREPSQVDAAKHAVEQERRAKELLKEKQRMRETIEGVVSEFRASRKALVDVLVENNKGKGKLLHRDKPVPKLELPKQFSAVISWAEQVSKLGSIQPVTEFKEWADRAVYRLNWEIENQGAISSKDLLNSPSEKALTDWAKG